MPIYSVIYARQAVEAARHSKKASDTMEFRAISTEQDYIEMGLYGTYEATYKRSRLYRNHPSLIGWIAIIVGSFSFIFGFLGFGRGRLRDVLCILLIALGALLFVSGCLFMATLGRVKKAYKIIAAQRCPEGVLSLAPQGITSTAADGSEQTFKSWQKIVRVLVTPNLVLFMCAGNMVLFIARRALQGREAEFWNYVSYYMPGKPIEHLCDK